MSGHVFCEPYSQDQKAKEILSEYKRQKQHLNDASDFIFATSSFLSSSLSNFGAVMSASCYCLHLYRQIVKLLYKLLLVVRTKSIADRYNLVFA